MPLHAGVPGALPDGGVIRKIANTKRLGARNPFRPFAFRFFTPSLLFVPIKIVLF